MISLALILKIIVMAAMILGWNAHLSRPRNYRNYSKDRIEHVADSLLNNWAENEMKRDTL